MFKGWRKLHPFFYGNDSIKHLCNKYQRLAYNNMKLKSIFLLLIIISLRQQTIGQTKWIAHESHSGAPEHFSPHCYADNFGLVEPPPFLDSIVKINDSTIVKYLSQMSTPFFYDTIVNHPVWLSPNLDLDSTQKHYGEEVALIGFSKEMPAKPAEVAPIVCKKKKRGLLKKNRQALMVTKNKRSSLPFFFALFAATALFIKGQKKF